jgi:hypothetical protein
MIRLYGRNYRRVAKGARSYWTDIQGWCRTRKRLTRREPFFINVTSKSQVPEFRDLSPMLMGPVDCYRENGRLITAGSVEVAWQYSKVYSHIWNKNGKLEDVRRRFVTSDAEGNEGPTREWFRWRDAAYGNPRFIHNHPQFEANKILVRHPFPKGPKATRSRVAFWYWNGKILDAVQARQHIYARLYKQFVLRTPGFRQLRERCARGDDLKIFDRDGYDWVDLRMTPADCVKDPNHSFGHGMVIAFLLQNIDPTKLVTNGQSRD